MKKLYSTIIILISIFLSQNVSAQCPGATFTSKVIDSTKTAIFTNTTTATFHTYYWTFGDGQNSSLKSPTHQYSKSGQFWVELKGIDTIKKCFDTAGMWINISCTAPQKPINTTKSGNLTICSDKSTSLTVKGIGNLGWYTAPTGGTYLGKDSTFITPKLSKTTTFYVQDSTCKTSSSRTAVTVTVKEAPKAAFSFPSFVCDKTDIKFTNQSSIQTGTMSYTWNFGDGGVSTLSDPIHQFATPTTKYVKMKAVSDFGCVDSVVRTITLSESPNADFTYGPVCNLTKTDFTFTGTKPTGALTVFLWNFNGEGTSTLENPSKLLDTGVKKITLILTSNNGCKDSIIKTMKVRPQAKADFMVQDVCEDDSAVFVNQSIGASSYRWILGDGRDAYVESPKHKYQLSGVSLTFNVTLISKISNGCSDSITKPITVNANPKSDFTYTMSGDSIQCRPNQSGNTYYKWTFGNGDSSTSANLDYAYPKPGKYKLCLSVISSAGCFSETCISISVGCKAKFTKSVDTSQKFKIYLINNSSSTSTTTYQWDFGDGGTSTTRTPTHKYATFGKFRVCLTVQDTGCSSTFCDTIGLDSSGKLLKAGTFEVVVIEGTGSILKTKPKTDFTIYPNPANTKVTIDLSKSIIHYNKLEITDAIGQTCFTQAIENGNKTLDLDLRIITPGLYFIKLSNKTDYSFMKMIKN